MQSADGDGGVGQYGTSDSGTGNESTNEDRSVREIIPTVL